MNGRRPIWNARAVVEFFDWLAAKGVTQLAAIESVHVAAYIEQLSRARSAPTAKLRLAALHHPFDWTMIGQSMPTNPAAAVPGPRHIVRRGKTSGSTRRCAPAHRCDRQDDRHRPPRQSLDWPQSSIPSRASARRAASNTPCRATTISNPIGTRTSTAWGSRAIRGAVVSDLQPCDWPSHRQSPAPGERLCDDLAARRGGRDHDQDQQPHVSGHGHHRLSQERRELDRAAQMPNHASTRTTQLYEGSERRACCAWIGPAHRGPRPRRRRPAKDKLSAHRFSDRKMPSRVRLGAALAQAPSDHRPEVVHPAADRLVRDRDFALSEQILDVTKAEREPEVEPDRLMYDLRRKPVSGVADFPHAPRLPRLPRSNKLTPA